MTAESVKVPDASDLVNQLGQLGNRRQAEKAVTARTAAKMGEHEANADEKVSAADEKYQQELEQIDDDLQARIAEEAAKDVADKKSLRELYKAQKHLQLSVYHSTPDDQKTAEMQKVYNRNVLGKYAKRAAWGLSLIAAAAITNIDRLTDVDAPKIDLDFGKATTTQAAKPANNNDFAPNPRYRIQTGWYGTDKEQAKDGVIERPGPDNDDLVCRKKNAQGQIEYVTASHMGDTFATEAEAREFIDDNKGSLPSKAYPARNLDCPT